MMRRLLKFMNYAAQLMALIDIGKQICEHLASKKQPTIQKRSATTNYQVIALSSSDPYRIQNIEFYEI